jgi:hypothetical protein
MFLGSIVRPVFSVGNLTAIYEPILNISQPYRPPRPVKGIAYFRCRPTLSAPRFGASSFSIFFVQSGIGVGFSEHLGSSCQFSFQQTLHIINRPTINTTQCRVWHRCDKFERERTSFTPSRWPRGTLYLQKLALTSRTSGGHSVGVGLGPRSSWQFPRKGVGRPVHPSNDLKREICVALTKPEILIPVLCSLITRTFILHLNLDFRCSELSSDVLKKDINKFFWKF